MAQEDHRFEEPEQKYENWDRTKMVDGSYSDATADITVSESAQGPHMQTAGANVTGGQSTKTYTGTPIANS